MYRNYLKYIFLTLLFMAIAFPVNSYSGNELIVRYPVKAYQIHISLDTLEHKITGNVDITYPGTGSNLVGFLLNSDFTVKSAVINGEKVKLKKKKLNSIQRKFLLNYEVARI